MSIVLGYLGGRKGGHARLLWAGLFLTLASVPAQGSPFRGFGGRPALGFTGAPARVQLGLTPTLGTQTARTFWAGSGRVSAASVNSSPFPMYYQRAMTTQATNVNVPPILRAMAARGMYSADTPLMQYLQWRRSLNPARFDYYHPRLGPSLAQTTWTPSPTPTPPCTCTPCQQVQPQREPRTEPQGPPWTEPPAVPEPSTGVMALTLIGAACWWRRRSRSS